MKFAMRTLLLCTFLSIAFAAHAEPVEYVKVCDQYGAGFFYFPGTDTCVNPRTGDTRVETEGGTWRTRTPYPTGQWLKKTDLECRGRVVSLGSFKSTDFTLNPWERKQTAPIPLSIGENEYISRVMMSGGFYDPRLSANRFGGTGEDAFCLRAIDPSIPEVQPDPEPEDPPRKYRWGNGMLPIACIANGRLLNMPPYAVDAEASYPSVEVGFANAAQTEKFGPWTYNTHVIVTTDAGRGGDAILMYKDASDEEELKPRAGELSVSVCVAPVRAGVR